MGEFAAELRRLRAEAGFRSAWAFHRARGARALGCTFKAYLYMEKGRSLPQAALALRLALGLGLAGGSEGGRRFVGAYLRSLVGRPELAGFLMRTLGAGAGPAGMTALFQRASGRLYAGKSVAITRSQADVLLSDWVVYWCWIMLSDDSGRWTAEQAARRLGVPAARARKALRAVVGLGLFEEDAAGLFRCPQAGKAFNFPRESLYLPRQRAAVERAWGEMARRRGAVLFDRYFLARASEAEARAFFPHLAQMAAGARVYAVTEPGPDTAFIALTARLRRVAPF